MDEFNKGDKHDQIISCFRRTSKWWKKSNGFRSVKSSNVNIAGILHVIPAEVLRERPQCVHYCWNNYPSLTISYCP